MEKQSDSKKKPSRRKYIFAVVAIISLCVIAGLIYRAVTWTPIDSESKKASEAIIRQAAAKKRYLNKEPNDLTDEDFAKIMYFRLQRSRLSDIKMLEKFTGLKHLTLEFTKFSKKGSPKWMTFLAKLGILDLSDRTYIDLSPLENLENLRELYINATKIKKIESLASLTNLQELGLIDSPISDLEPIKELKSLEEIYIYGTQVSDLKPLKELKNLQTLWIDNTLISDLEPLRGLTKLTSLSIYRTQVNSLEPLEGLMNLKILLLRDTQVSDLEYIKELTNLEQLDIRGTTVSDLEPIKSLTHLRSLVISYDKFSDEQVKDLQMALPNLKFEKNLKNDK